MHRTARKILDAASSTSLRVLASLLTAVLAIVLAVWLLPEWLNSSTTIDPASQLKVEDWLSAKNATRTSLVALLVATVGMGTLLYTVRSYHLARTGQVTDRYTKAVDQLGSDDKPQVRVGGVYALERIVRDSPKDQRAVVDVLVAHVRESRFLGREPAPEARIPVDVTAALQVLGRQSRGSDLPALDLRNLDLREAELTNADLSGCHLDGTNLDGAVLTGANLRGALLSGASLNRAKLLSTNLIRADLTTVALKDADFFGAKILPQQLSGTQRAEVVNWEFAETYTSVGPLRPRSRTTR